MIRKAVTKDRPTLVSLFTGAGGLDLGLESAGFTTLVATDVNEPACATLRANQLLPTLTDDEFDAWLDEQFRQRCYKNATKSEVRELRARVGHRSHDFLREARIIDRDVRSLRSAELLEAANVRKGEVTLVA